MSNKCGHTGVDWNGLGDCITCARDKVLNNSPAPGEQEESNDKETKLKKLERLYGKDKQTNLNQCVANLRKIGFTAMAKLIGEK